MRASGSNFAPSPVLKYQPSPKPSPLAKSLTGQSTIKEPNYIDINTTEDAVNSVMAEGWQNADSRYLGKRMQRNGVSAGKGQQFIANQEGAQNISEAAGKAADIRSQDMAANSKMRSEYEKAREQEAQALSMIQHSKDQSDWAKQFAYQSAQAQIQMAQQQAQLQLMMALMRG